MKTLFLTIFLALFSLTVIIPCAYADPRDEDEYSGNMNFFLGVKTLDKDDWEPIDEHGEVGVMFDVKKEGWPVHLAMDILVSATEETDGGQDIELGISEFDLGIRKILDLGDVHPFVGGGVSFMSAEYNIVDVTKCSGGGLGGWVDAGIFFTLGESFNLGFEARASTADATLECGNGTEFDANIGGEHFGILLGYRWR